MHGVQFACDQIPNAQVHPAVGIDPLPLVVQLILQGDSELGDNFHRIVYLSPSCPLRQSCQIVQDIKVSSDRLAYIGALYFQNHWGAISQDSRMHLGQRSRAYGSGLDFLEGCFQ